MEIPLFRSGALGVLLFVSMAGMQTHSKSSSQNASRPTSVNGSGEIAAAPAKPSTLDLNFSTDKAELQDGECANLQLTVLNSGARPIRWKADWIFEQDGPQALPESFPRSEIELPPGVKTTAVSIRICGSDLKPGNYRYRISEGRTATTPLHSNWLAIKVIRQRDAKVIR